MSKTAEKVRWMAAWLVLVLAFLSLAPAATAEAATPEAFIFLKGSSPRKKYTSSKPRYIYVGGKKVNFDYYVDGKTKGIKGTWKSSDTKIVTVDKSGIARAVGNGKATISFTFTYKGKKYSMKTYVVGRTRAESCTVKVVEPSDFDGTMEVGDWIDINRTMTAKAKARAVTPGIKTTYKAYGELYDDEDCTVVHDGSVATLGDKFIVTGESDGVVYFKANARNSKTNMDYNVDSNVIKITVGEGKKDEEGNDKPEEPDEPLTTGATQTDVDKIKVTSTTDINSVTIKMGNTILTQRQGSPEIAADRKSAIVSIPGNYQTATYTVLINDVTSSGIDVKCETRRIEKIELDSPYAVLDREVATIVNNKTVYPKATVKYRVFDQFGNDVTTNPSYPYSDFYGGGIFRVIGQGVMEFEFPYNPVLGTKYDVVLVHQGSGKTLREQVELAKPAYVEKVSFAGIYRYNSSKNDYELMSDGTITNMSEGDADIVAFGGSVNNTKTNGAYYALFKAENQYGGNAAGPGVGFTSMVVNMSPGMTNLNLETVDYNGVKQVQSINPISVNNVDHVAYPLKAGAIKEGTAYLTAFAVGSSTNLSINIKVNPKRGIKTFNISAPETLYEGKATYLDYSIVDTYGAAVTDYATLVKYSNLNDNGNTAIFPEGSSFINSSSKSTFAWEKQEDGSAKLRYTPMTRDTSSTTASTAIAYSDIIMTRSGTVDVKTFNFSVYSKPIPTTLYGLHSDAGLGAIVGGNRLAIRVKDLQVIDQYGATMTAEMLKKSGFSIKVEGFNPSSGVFTATGSAINKEVAFTGGVDNLEKDTGIYQPIVDLTTGGIAGSATLSLSLYRGTTRVETSNTITVTVKSVSWSDVVASSYKVTSLGSLSNRDTADYSFEVTGQTADGTKIAIPKENCVIYGSGDAGRFVKRVGAVSGGSAGYDVLDPDAVSLGSNSGNASNPGLGYAVNSNGYRQATFTYTVVIIDGRGSSITTNVTISDEAERIAQLQVTTAGTNVEINKNVNIWNELITKGLITAKDQYGRTYALTNTSSSIDRNNIIRVTVTGGSNDMNVSMNGTQNAMIVNGSGTVTIRINVNNLDAQTIQATIR